MPKRLKSDAWLVPLKELPGLQALSLQLGSKITNAGLAHLAGLTSLEELNLTGTAVTGAGLAHLKKLTGLRILTLHDCRLTDLG